LHGPKSRLAGVSKSESGESGEPVTHEGKASLNLGFGGSASATVERGLNDIRLAVLGVLVTIGLTVGFGVSGPLWQRVAWGVAAFAAACGLIAWSRSRHLLMEFMHRLTGH
jgi:hypothetical protein